MASASRSRGGALVTRDRSNSRAASDTWSTARSKASWFAWEGRVKPLSFRTNCREDAWISSSVAGGLKLCSVLMLRHIDHPLCLKSGSGGPTSRLTRPDGGEQYGLALGGPPPLGS